MSGFIPFGVMPFSAPAPTSALPAAGQWVRLEIPASAVGLEGQVVQGLLDGVLRRGFDAHVSEGCRLGTAFLDHGFDGHRDLAELEEVALLERACF